MAPSKEQPVKSPMKKDTKIVANGTSSGKSGNKKEGSSHNNDENNKKDKDNALQLRRTLSDAKEWDVWSPPPDDSLKGHFVPNVLNRYSRRRRISLEVHRIHLPAQQALPDTISTTPGLLEKKSIVRKREEQEAEEEKGRITTKTKTKTKESKDNKKKTTTTTPTMKLSPFTQTVQQQKNNQNDNNNDGKPAVQPSIATMAAVAKAAHKLKEGADEHHYDEIVFRILEPIDKSEKKSSLKEGKKARMTLKAKRKAVAMGTAVRLAGTRSVEELRKSSTGKEYHSVCGSGTDHGDDDDGDDDDSSVDTHKVMMSADDSTFVGNSMIDIDEHDYVDITTGEISKDWHPKYIFPIDAVSITKQKHNRINIVTNHRGIKHTRTLIFDTDEDALYFVSTMKEYRERHKQSVDHKLKQALDGMIVNQNKTLKLLIEIVSGWDLPAADVSVATSPTSDPFVKVYLNGIAVHRTKHIPRTLNPIWTLKTGSLFILECTVKELFASPEGVMFQVFDYDKLGASDSLGSVMIPPKVLYDAKGDRMECKLSKAPGQSMDASGYLAVRCRHATPYDIEFMEQWGESELSGSTTQRGHQTVAEKIGENVSGGRSSIQSYLTKYRKVEREGPNAGKTMYKVRPKPDPKRVEQTTWLTKDEIEAETYKDSHHWLDVSTGVLGRLYVEILSCDGLPNLDTGIAGNKTDAFVQCIFEDVIMKTDIIDDTLSPRWLPWSKRSFIFNMRHSSSQLFLGVFDFDGSPIDDHDMIGRVAVSVANMEPNTVYLLKYDLYADVSMSERDEKNRRGVITLRVRLEVDDERRMLTANLGPVPEVYINVKNKKDYRAAKETMRGSVDTDKYNKAVISSYVEELTAYKYILYHLEDAAIALFLWRGIASLKVLGKTVKIPVHSMIAFVAGVMIVERPTLAPCFFFATISWVMLALMGWRIEAPNPWLRCKGFHEFLQILVIGKSLSGPALIKANENLEESRKFEKEFKERITKAEKQAEREAAEALKREEERQKELEELGEVDGDLSDKSSGISIDPLKSILYPIQQYLGMTVKGVRLVKYVLMWEECYYSFWISTGCFVLAFVSLLIPWAFILRWTARITVWALLGPWMKLVDIFYFSKIKELTDDELEEKIKADREKHKEETVSFVAKERVRKEDATKLKEFKKYMFGQYICKVPILCTERYIDCPRHESVAIPYKPKKLGLADLAMKEAGYNRTRLPGQNLTGHMIPRVESKSLSDAPVGRAIANVDRLDEKSPGAKVPRTESNAAAYAKLGSLVVAAGLISWFGVPYVTWATESAWLFAKAKVGL